MSILKPRIRVVGYCFTGLFSVELLLRFLAQGRAFASLRNREWRWNLLDSIIVLASLYEVGMDVVNLAMGAEATQMTGMSGLRTLRIVRITRLVKVARLARVLRFIMALRTLTQSILHTMKSLIWAMVLLCLVVYTFAVLFTQAPFFFLKKRKRAVEPEDLTECRCFSGFSLVFGAATPCFHVVQVVNDHLEMHEGNMTQEVEDLAKTYFRSLPQVGFSSRSLAAELLNGL